jgi:hypothetical protein
MQFITSEGNLSPTFIGQDYTLVRGDEIGKMMKSVYNIPNNRTSEAQGYYRAFWELQVRGGYIPSSHQENLINVGEIVHFYPLAEIEAQRNTPGLLDRIVTYTPTVNIDPQPERNVPDTSIVEQSMFSNLFTLKGLALMIGVGSIAYMVFGKKKGKK